MTTERAQRPAVSRSQLIGKKGVQAFQASSPSNWFVKQLDGDDDFGLDAFVQVTDPETQYVEFAFFVQIKGTESLSHAGDEGLAVSVDTKTINYALGLAQDVMLVGVDLTTAPEPRYCEVYFIWLQDAARQRLPEGATEFKDQESLTVRVPYRNRISPQLDLTEELRRRQTLSRASAGFARTVGNIADLEPSTVPAFLDEIRSKVKQHGLGVLNTPELESDFPWPQPPTHSLAYQLQEISRDVDNGDLDRAASLLASIEQDAKAAGNQVYAEHLLQRSRILSFEGDKDAAVALLVQAYDVHSHSERVVVALVEARLSQRVELTLSPNVEDLVPYLNKFSGDRAIQVRAKLFASSGDTDRAIKELERAPADRVIATKALVLNLQRKWTQTLRETQSVLDAQKLRPYAELLVRIFRARAHFHCGIADLDDSELEEIPAFGPPNYNVSDIRASWDEAQKALSIAEIIGYPPPIEFLSDVFAQISLMLERHVQALDILRRVCDRRPYFKDTLAATHRLAVMRGDPHCAVETYGRLVALHAERPHRCSTVIALFENKKFHEALAMAQALLDDEDGAGPLLPIAYGMAALAANSLSRPSQEKRFESRLESRSEWSGSLEVFRYLRAIANSPLEKEAAVAKLKDAWRATRSRLVGMQLLHTLDVGNGSEAADAELTIEIAESLSNSMSLGIDETLAFTRALARLERWTQVADTATRALKKYPDRIELTGTVALALENMGKSAEAIDLLRRTSVDRTSSRFILSTFANIAARCGYTNEAIDSFERLLATEGSREQRFEILRLIFTLELERDPTSPILLDRSYALGSVADQASEVEEGIYLISFFMATAGAGATPSAEQLEDITARVQAFQAAWPRSTVFRAVQMPQDPGTIEDVLRAEGLLGDSRPEQSRRLEQQVRHGAYLPYAWRPQVLPEVGDIAVLWELTKYGPRRPEYQLQMCIPEQGGSHQKSVRLPQKILVDLPSLFVLQDLGILEGVVLSVPAIAISKLTLLSIRALGHPWSGSVQGGTARAVGETLKRLIGKFTQPGRNLIGEKGTTALEKAREDDQRSLLNSGYSLLSDDAGWAAAVFESASKISCFNTGHLLRFLDEQGQLEVLDVAMKFAQLCTWNIVDVPVNDRYFYAAFPARLGICRTVPEFDAAFSEEPIRTFLDAFWRYDQPLTEFTGTAARVVAYLASAGSATDRQIAAFSRQWFVKAKLRAKSTTESLSMLVCVAALAINNVENASPEQVKRIWDAYLQVVEWDQGPSMSIEKEQEAITAFGKFLGEITKRTSDIGGGPNGGLTLFRKVQSGLTAGTIFYSTFERGYQDAASRERAR